MIVVLGIHWCEGWLCRGGKIHGSDCEGRAEWRTPWEGCAFGLSSSLHPENFNRDDHHGSSWIETRREFAIQWRQSTVSFNIKFNPVDNFGINWFLSKLPCFLMMFYAHEGHQLPPCLSPWVNRCLVNHEPLNVRPSRSLLISVAPCCSKMCRLPQCEALAIPPQAMADTAMNYWDTMGHSLTEENTVVLLHKNDSIGEIYKYSSKSWGSIEETHLLILSIRKIRHLLKHNTI